MKARIKKLWLAALRSGEIKQAKNQLRKGNDMCCLGVLCNIHAQAHPEIAAQQLSKTCYMGEAQTLPKAVVDWAGLTVRSPKVKAEGKKMMISELNDRGHSFLKIADLIENQL